MPTSVFDLPQRFELKMSYIDLRKKTYNGQSEYLMKEVNTH